MIKTSDLADLFQNKYYGMQNAEGRFVTMPCICSKTDKYVGVVFTSEALAGDSRGYKVCFGAKTVKRAAEKAIAKYPSSAFRIYRLHKRRPKADSFEEIDY